MPVLSTHALGKRYGRRLGVEGVELSVDQGEIFGFLGPNGAGKTTVIRLLLGFLKPSSGESRIFDRDCWVKSHIIKRDTGYVPGDLRLYPWFTVRKALLISQAARNRECMQVGLALAERFRLDPDLSVRKMSRGMRQKLGLILALAHQPKLLVLDEPTGGLDPIMQQALAESLRERARDGCTIFFSSHTLSEVEQLCDRVAIVRDGRIVADQTLDEMRRRARRKIMIRFASSESVRQLDPPGFLNLIKCEGDQWHAELEGETGKLIQWLSEHSIRDVSIGPPDLETIFHAYYRTKEGTP